MLTFTQITLNSAELGAESLIPDIHDASRDPYFVRDDSVQSSQIPNMGKGMIKTILPYKMQNMYNREFDKRTYKAAILENDCLKAVFLPELGGRLWKLYDKIQKRDIIYENDAVIFANLGFSNAWFAGGVEWNVGMRGHCALGCRSMFARKAIGAVGNDILQMYEYEEKRGVIYSINATLDKDVLLVHPEIHNVSGEDTYMYWWSNIAVEQTPKTRTFVPAEYSFITSYREGGYNISRKSLPIINGKEISTCESAPEAIDYFYDIPEESSKWICSLNEYGKGLLQSSTKRLIGRKNFLWGKNAGGRHWNEWLTEGRDYYEIQAGLIKTQFEHFVMKPDEVIMWTEAYKGLALDTNEGDFFDVSHQIEKYLVDIDDKAEMFRVKEYCSLWHMGSGRGYLASLYRKKPISDIFEFPRSSVTDKQKLYVDIFYKRVRNVNIETDFTVNKEILKCLEDKEEKGWFEDYILGLGAFENEEYSKAYESFKNSVEKKRHYLSLAALGLFEGCINKQRSLAFSLIGEALEQRPDYYPLACVFAEAAIEAREYEAFCHYYENACDAIKIAGRMKMYVAQCYCMRNMLEKASEYLNENLLVPDIREGEYSMSNVWVMLKKRIMARDKNVNPELLTDADVLKEYPVPYNIDFRMHPAPLAK